MPEGFELARSGEIRRRTERAARDGETHKLDKVVSDPVFVTGLSVDLATTSHGMTLKWRRGSEWSEAEVQRRDALDARRIVSLAALGFPVTSTNAGTLADYIAEAERMNLPTLYKSERFSRYTSRCGWVEISGELVGFMCGETMIPRPPSSPAVSFRPVDEGEGQIAREIRSRGTLEEWFAAIEPFAHLPKLVLAVYVALVPPMLRVLDADNFAVDWSGPSSCGKTTALSVLASVWGNPDPRSSSIVGSWDTTRTWFERAMGVLDGLPIIADETQRARDPDSVGQTVYDVASGRLRARGTVTGMAKTLSAKTVLCSTGERPLASFSAAGGAKARILSIQGSPFESETAAVAVAGLAEAVRRSHGHVGPEIVRWALRMGLEDVSTWRRRHRARREDYVRLAGGRGVSSRAADYVASIETVAEMAHSALKFPWPYPSEGMARVWEEAERALADADVAKVALEFALSWAGANMARFLGRHEHSDAGGRPISPGIGWAGEWPAGEDFEHVGFFPSVLHEVLNKNNHDESVIKLWRTRGWLSTEGNGVSVIRWVGGASHRMIVVKRSAYDEIIEGKRGRDVASNGPVVLPF